MDLDRYTDEQLLLAVRSPERARRSFEAFYRRHERLVVAFHVRRVRDGELAADLTAETFTQALAARQRFQDRGPNTGVAWLYAIAANVLARSARTEAHERYKHEQLMIERPALTEEQVGVIERLSETSEIESTLRQLPAGQREAIAAYIFTDASYDELARQLDCTPATLRQRVSRGLATLRRELEEAR